MGDFSDRSSSAKPLRIPMNVLLQYAEEARRAAARRPPKRFRTPSSETGLKFDERSLSTTRVRQRLCDLMGTDVIRLNDKRYFQKLSQRLQEEYEGVMDKQEEARAAQENERLRRLMLEGIIEAPDDYRAIVHGEHKPKAQKTKKRKTKRRIRITESQEGHDSEHAQSREAEEDNVTVTSKEDVRTQVEMLADAQRTDDTPDGREKRETKTTPTSILKKREDTENDNSAQRAREMHVRPPHHENAGRSSSSCSNYRKSRRIKSAAPRLTREKENQSEDSNEDIEDRKFDTHSLPDRDYHRRFSKYSKHEPESIRRLRMEQTVAGLYSIAEELVSPVRTDEASDRRGKKPY